MSSDTKALMNKTMFLEFDIEAQIEYLNDRLNEGLTVTDIRGELGIGEKKLQKLLKENGYRYNPKIKQYESSEEVIYKSTTEVVKATTSTPATTVGNENNEFMLKLIREIEELKSMNTKVVELYEWYENQKNVVEPMQLVVDLREDTTTTVKSYKVYTTTEKDFQELCKKYSHLKVQDLISKAIDEFIMKYK